MGEIFFWQYSAAEARNVMANKALHVLPMLRGRGYSGAHHWKAVSDPERGISTLTAMNIPSRSKPFYIDFLFDLEHPEAAIELHSILEESIRVSCAHPEDVECLLAFVYGESAENQEILSSFKHSCQVFEDRVYAQRASAKRDSKARVLGKYFMQPSDTDLTYLLEQKIASAKEEVLLMSHRILSQPVLSALDKAHAHGVRVIALSGSYNPPPPRPFLFDVLHAPIRMPIPHMRTLLIDRHELLFGTANISTTGLSLSRELFAVTHNPKAIAQTVDLARALLRAFKKEALLGAGALQDRQWIVGRKEHGRYDRLYGQSLPLDGRFHLASAQGHEGLRECGLGTLPLISVSDANSCFESRESELSR